MAYIPEDILKIVGNLVKAKQILKAYKILNCFLTSLDARKKLLGLLHLKQKEVL